MSGTVWGSFDGISTDRVRPYFTYSYSQSIAGNYSDITISLYFTRVNTSWYGYGTTSANGNIDGYWDNQSGIAFNLTGGTVTQLIKTYTRRVYHNADGTRSVWIGYTGTTDIFWGSLNFGVAITLPTIPRRATLSGDANLTIGNNKTYSLTNPGGLYVRMEYWINGNAGWYRVKNQNNGTGTSGTFTMSSTDNNNMYSRMPSVTSASAIMRAYTYSDAGYSVQVGDYHDVNGTVYINQTTNKPTFSNFTVENVDKTISVVDKYGNALVSSSTATLLDSTTKMIKSRSKIRAVVTSANKMVAQNYATNIKYRFIAGSSTKDENYHASNTVNLDIDNATTGSVSVTAYDSRNLTTTVNKSFDYVANYVPISIWGLELIRDNGVDSETKLKFSGKLWKEYFGGGTSGVQNTVTAHWRYKPTTDSWDAQTWNAITPTDDGSGNLSYEAYINGDLGASGFDTKSSFSVEVRVFDKLSQQIIEGTLNVGTPVMDITKDGIALGARYDNTEGGLLQVLGKSLLEIMYPVGSVYINAGVSTSPATLMGFGTWEAYGAGRVIVGKNSSGTFKTLGATGGAETHTLSTSEIPAHNHSIYNKATATTFVSPGSNAPAQTGGVRTWVNIADNYLSTYNRGGGGSHNNLQPYIVAYMWKRTA